MGNILYAIKESRGPELLFLSVSAVNDEILNV